MSAYAALFLGGLLIGGMVLLVYLIWNVYDLMRSMP